MNISALFWLTSFYIDRFCFILQFNPNLKIFMEEFVA